MVGVRRLEPPPSASRTLRARQLRHTPKTLRNYTIRFAYLLIYLFLMLLCLGKYFLKMLIFTINGFIRCGGLVAIFFLILLTGEVLRRKKIIQGEAARKFVHATTGTWAAMWPAFIDLRSIALLALLMSFGAILFRNLKLFPSVYSIRRLSIGEVLIGFGLAAAALLAKSGAVFASSLLVIAWSDSLAALVGVSLGKKNSFKILGTKKSLAGSLAFFLSTIVVIMTFLYYRLGSDMYRDPMQLLVSLLVASMVSFCLTIVELTGIYGIDNLTIPLFAVLVLNNI